MTLFYIFANLLMFGLMEDGWILFWSKYNEEKGVPYRPLKGSQRDPQGSWTTLFKYLG